MTATALDPLATEELKRKIVGNTFGRRLRELLVDREEFGRLCGALEELARQWRGSALVDREVASALHALSMVARDVIPILGRTDPRIKDEMEDMGIRLSSLIRACFEPGIREQAPPI
jgi:hypothetical protein